MSRVFLTLFFLTLLPVFGCANHSSGKGPRDVVFAYANGDGIYVLSGDGSINKKIIGGAYFQAALSPDRTKLACVYDQDFQITIFNLDSNFESQGRPKTVFNSQAQSQGDSNTRVCCPTWSSDSQKFYFINLNHLIVYDYGEKKTTFLFDFPESQSGGQYPETGNMKLSKNGDTLNCLLNESGDKWAFWDINLSSMQGTLVGNPGKYAFLEGRIPPDLPEEIVENFFGSRENRVLGPIHSADHHYYFYYHKDEGYLAWHGILGYNRETKEKFDVFSFGTTLFPE